MRLRLDFFRCRLRNWQSRQGGRLPDEPTSLKKAALDRLSALSGPVFGREYRQQVGIEGHKADSPIFEAASRTASHPDLKVWRNKVLPELHGHLSEAQKTPQAIASLH